MCKGVNPAYGVVYTGKRWIIGTKDNGIWYSAPKDPTSTYIQIQYNSPQWPNAIMSNGSSVTIVGGSGNNSNRLYKFNETTTSFSFYTSTTPFVTSPSHIRQIGYVKSSATWFVPMAGTVNGNNSLRISSNNGTSWTDISSVHTNLRVCEGGAAVI